MFPCAARCEVLRPSAMACADPEALARIREHIDAARHGGELPEPRVLAGDLRKHLAGLDPVLRSASLRLLRHSVARDRAVWREALRQHVDFYVVRSLERETSTLDERVEALKLFRHLSEHASSDLPASQLMSVVSIADCTEDNLRSVSLETLRQLLVFQGTGEARQHLVQPLLNAMVPSGDGVEPAGRHLALPLLFTFAYMLDRSETRSWLRVPRDVQLLLSPLSELEAPTSERSAAITIGRYRVIPLSRTSAEELAACSADRKSVSRCWPVTRYCE